MFSAAARASRLLRTHSAHMPDATRLYRSPLPRQPRAPPLTLPPTPPPRAPSLPPQPTREAGLVGLVSGTLGSLCGVGGAVFAIPLLVRHAALPQRQAAAVSLVAVTCVAATSAASVAAATPDPLDWSLICSLSGGAALLTPLGAAASARVNAPALRRLLGAFMLLLAPVMPLRAHLQHRDQHDHVPHAHNHPAMVTAIGSLVGFTSGLLGVSGGSLFTPLVAILSPALSFKSVMATSFASMIIPTACGAVSYARMGLLRAVLLPPLVVGALCGAVVGSNVALMVPDVILQSAFAVVFTVMGLRIVRAPIASPQTVAHATKAARTQRGVRVTAAPS